MRMRRNSVNGLLLFLIYGMFALFSMLLVVIGARVYRNIVAVGEENTQTRAAFSYVSNKVRAKGGAEDAVSLEEREGIGVLTLAGDVENQGYETCIYFYDGKLCESYRSVGQPFSPELGEKIVEVEDFIMEETDTGQLLISVKDSHGNWRSMHLNE